jgi:plastocyanin
MREKMLDFGRCSGLAVLMLPLIAACGSSPSAPGDPEAIITITASGISPKEVRIKAWNSVRFVNDDTRAHTIVSDPIDLHTQCPPLNRIGTLQPGQSRDTGTLNLTGACGFHDHDDQVEAFRGRIVVE